MRGHSAGLRAGLSAGLREGAVGYTGGDGKMLTATLETECLPGCLWTVSGLQARRKQCKWQQTVPDHAVRRYSQAQHSLQEKEKGNIKNTC